MKSIVKLNLLMALVFAGSIQAFEIFNIDIDKRIDRNNALIKQYEQSISKLKKENKSILEKKSKNPELYVKKPLYEDLKDKYIYRIKLNGAKADSLNFMIKDDVVSLNMNMKMEEKNEHGYFYNSHYFSTSYSIPSDVKQDKISHKVDGDYFTILMPKK